MEKGVGNERRWKWWGQTRDIVAFVLGCGLLVFEATKEHSDPAIIVAALACLGVVGSGVLTRWLVGRWNGNRER